MRISLLILTKFERINERLISNLPDRRSKTCRWFIIFDDLNKFKVSLLHEKRSKIGKSMDADHLDQRILSITNSMTNTCVETLMNIQIFILVKPTLSLKEIQRPSLIVK